MSAMAEIRRGHRWWIFGTLAVVSTLVALRLLTSALAVPLETPARLAQGELHLITLSLNSLRVRAQGVPGSGVVQFSATSPIITAFQTPNRPVFASVGERVA